MFDLWKFDCRWNLADTTTPEEQQKQQLLAADNKGQDRSQWKGVVLFGGHKRASNGYSLSGFSRCSLLTAFHTLVSAQRTRKST